MASIVVLSSACAHVDKVDVVSVKGASQVKPVADEKQKETPKPQESQLDAALLFSLLSGEIAGQRGDVNMASAFYARAAEQSQDPQIAFRAAQVALYNKDIASAKAAIDIVVKAGNLDAQMRRLALTIYLRSGDVDKSLEQIDVLLDKGDIPKRNALLAVGDIVSRHANKDIAISVMDALVERNAKEAGVYVARSQLIAAFGDLNQAEQDAQEATKIDPSWAVSFVQLARVFENKGDTAGAIAVLKEASQRLGNNLLLMGYGQLLAKNEQYEEAKQQFIQLASADKNYPEAKFALGLVYLKLDDVKGAKETFEELYEVNSFPSKSAFYLGRIHYHEKENKQALEWFEKVGRGVHYVDAKSYLSMIKSELGDLEGARSIMQTLRNDFPKESSRFYLLEAELLMDGQHNQVLLDLMTVAVGEHTSDMSLRYARSIAATEVGDLALAEKDLLIVLEKTPKDANALNALGYTLASKTFRFKEARNYLTQALSIRPNDPAILDSMGWLNYREGHYEQALLLLQKAYAKSPDGEIAAHLGETMWILGRQKEARELWENALKKDEDNRYLLEVLKRLK
ncbi:MAG: tetratricopeptide repeat protein [Cycloclasticus sp.]|nr:tetratricopeptide repeat protein [Cycloclasticus sp.]